jgi:hypothetical protein
MHIIHLQPAHRIYTTHLPPHQTHATNIPRKEPYYAPLITLPSLLTMASTTTATTILHENHPPACRCRSCCTTFWVLDAATDVEAAFPGPPIVSVFTGARAECAMRSDAGSVRDDLMVGAEDGAEPSTDKGAGVGTRDVVWDEAVDPGALSCSANVSLRFNHNRWYNDTNMSYSHGS